jgi:hypothetical protein
MVSRIFFSLSRKFWNRALNYGSHFFIFFPFCYSLTKLPFGAVYLNVTHPLVLFVSDAACSELLTGLLNNHKPINKYGTFITQLVYVACICLCG